jgi:hypothetical protein
VSLLKRYLAWIAAIKRKQKKATYGQIQYKEMRHD